MDVDHWINSTWCNTRNPNVTFIPSDNIEQIDEDSIDFILVSHTLHYIDDKTIENIIRNFYRILKNNGTILLIEHDSKNEKFDELLNIQHVLYDVVLESDNLSVSQVEEKLIIFYKSYIGNYKSQNEWRNKFKENGFSYSGVINQKKLDKTYYELFKKKYN